jgi:hypothetical protein
MITEMKKIALGTMISLLAFSANAGVIKIYDSADPLTSLDDAQDVIDAASAPDLVAETDYVWFSDSGTNPYGDGVGMPFPGGFDHTFVMEITGLIDTNNYSKLYLGHDDGLSISVGDTVIYEYGALTDFRASGEILLGAAAGMQMLHGLYYENAGEADLFLWGYRRINNTWERARIHAVSEPATLALFGIGLVGLGMTRRRRTQIK